MAISCLSAWMMCPLMSFFATLLFKDSHNANFVAIWAQTTMLNYPAAFLWQLAAAGPLVRTVFWRRIALHREKSETQRHIVKFVPIKLHKSRRAIFGESAIIRDETRKNPNSRNEVHGMKDVDAF